GQGQGHGQGQGQGNGGGNILCREKMMLPEFHGSTAKERWLDFDKSRAFSTSTGHSSCHLLSRCSSLGAFITTFGNFGTNLAPFFNSFHIERSESTQCGWDRMFHIDCAVDEDQFFF